MFEDRRVELPELAELPAPVWSEHPVYAQSMSDAERLRDLMQTGPAARSTADLAGLDPRFLSDLDRVDLLATLSEQLNWLEAAKARVLAAIDEGDSTAARLSQEAVSLALMVSGRSAQRQLKTAATLTKDLPQTYQLLARGKISGRHAEVIAEASWRLPPEVLPALEARVTPRAPEQTVPQFKQAVRRAAISLDPATAEQRHQNALADRRVEFQALDDGWRNCRC